MKNEDQRSGYIVYGTKEGDQPGARSLSIHTRNIEEAISCLRAALEVGETTCVTVVLEDRYIRDGRRKAGLDPNVEIEGFPGRRIVKKRE